MEMKGKRIGVRCKVAVIEPVGGHGGMHYYDFGLCAGLTHAGVDVVLHTCNETTQFKNFVVRYTFSSIYGRAPAWERGLRYSWGSLLSVLFAVKEGRRVCHFHLFHVGLLETFNITLAKVFFRKIVITAHDVESFVENLSVPKLARWVYSISDGVIAHNCISKDELMDKLNVPEEKISIIPHGNYLHMLQPVPLQKDARKKLNISNQAKVLLFFGQIKAVKGLDVLLEAMPVVIDAYPEVVLVIAGKPWKSDISYYEQKMLELGIQDYCHLDIRYIPDKDVVNYYAACDLVVLPYRRIYQSGVLFMAMSYGKCVLVSDLPGMKEVVTDGVNGFMFPCGDYQALALRLNEVLDDFVHLQSVAEKGFQHVRTHYDWMQIGAKTEALYHSLCKGAL